MANITIKSGEDYRFFGNPYPNIKGDDWVLVEDLLGFQLVAPFSLDTHQISFHYWDNYDVPVSVSALAKLSAAQREADPFQTWYFSAQSVIHGDYLVAGDRQWYQQEISGEPFWSPQPVSSTGSFNQVSPNTPRLDGWTRVSRTARPVVNPDQWGGTPNLVYWSETSAAYTITNTYTGNELLNNPFGTITKATQIDWLSANPYIYALPELTDVRDAAIPFTGFMTSGRTEFFTYSKWDATSGENWNFLSYFTFDMGIGGGFAAHNNFARVSGVWSVRDSGPVQLGVSANAINGKLQNYQLYTPRRDTFGIILDVVASADNGANRARKLSFDLWKTRVSGIPTHLSAGVNIKQEALLVVSAWGVFNNVQADFDDLGIAFYATVSTYVSATDSYSSEHKKWIHHWGTSAGAWSEYTVFSPQTLSSLSAEIPNIISFSDTTTTDDSVWDRLGKHIVITDVSAGAVPGGAPIEGSGAMELNDHNIEPVRMDYFEEYYNVVPVYLSSQTASFEQGTWGFDYTRFVNLTSQVMTVAQDIEVSAKNPFFERLTGQSISLTQAQVSAESARFITLAGQQMCVQQFYPFWKRKNKCSYESGRNDNRSDCP